MNKPKPTPDPVALRRLAQLGMGCAIGYAVVAWLSVKFAYSASFAERPIPFVVGLLITVLIVSLFVLRVALRAEDSRETLTIVLGFAIAFRLLLLLSYPIQEVDLYRYIWDGQVTQTIGDPFRYSPRQVRANIPEHLRPESLQRLIELQQEKPALKTILDRVHFKELPTVYPPVSQAVFLVVAWTTPPQASVSTYMIIMKAWIVLFDVGTILLLCGLLKRVGYHRGWVIVYAWNPLTLKEFTNSGHLDAIAVCLTIAAVCCAVKAFFPVGNTKLQPARSQILWGILAALLLALGVGAKLYPIVLAPLLVFTSIKRLGWKHTLLPGAVFGLVTLWVCWPMFLVKRDRTPTPGVNSQPRMTSPSPSEPIDVPRVDQPPFSESEDSSISSESTMKLTSQPDEGIDVYLKTWEMNDFLFMVLMEQTRPRKEPHWFVLTSRVWREHVCFRLANARWFQIVTREEQLKPQDVPFRLTRLITMTLFLGLALWWSFQVTRQCEIKAFLRAVFLTLAWFFLLLPTQNPWYWLWALPFVPFARSRVWLLLSGCLLLYYLRFWFSYHDEGQLLFGTRYHGEHFFDFVLVWLEYLPFFLLLFASVRQKKNCERRSKAEVE